MKDISIVNQGLQIAISNRYKSPGHALQLYITIQYLNDPTSEADTFYIKEANPSVICHKEDLLLVRTGNTGMVVIDVEGVFHNNFFKVNYNNRKVERNFLVHHLRSPEIQTLIRIYAGATTIPDLNHRDFYRLPFSCPPNSEQSIIAEILNKVEGNILSEVTYKKKLIEVKIALMQDLLTGKVRVNPDKPKDTPS